MKVLVAPDSFKGSATSQEISDYIGIGVKKAFPSAEVTKLPLADGGEGTLDTIITVLNGRIIEKEVTGPIGKKVIAKYGIAEDIAIIEMANASGLLLVKDNKRNPLYTTTYGTGELIKEAIEKGCKKIVVGIGGSATNDAGAGMAQALGYSFKDANNKEISFGGKELGKVVSIDTSKVITGLNDVEFIVACDVTNILCGESGASAVYGPQKGATQEDVKVLDDSLRHFANIIKVQLGKDVSNTPGSGAAGGLGAGLLAFCNAELKRGIEIILELIKIDKYLKDVDLVITGEGQIDGQSVYGKTPVGIARYAAKYGIPAIAIVGGIGDGLEEIYKNNILSVMSIVNKPMSLTKAQENVKELITSSAERAIRLIRVGEKINHY